ncbi:MAG TPA: hypothetical protein VKS60_00200 [Stellaceae bacterium]|nr:hypothetical protein [Stellaceae bacterium]
MLYPTGLLEELPLGGTKTASATVRSAARAAPAMNAVRAVAGVSTGASRAVPGANAIRALSGAAIGAARVSPAFGGLRVWAGAALAACGASLLGSALRGIAAWVSGAARPALAAGPSRVFTTYRAAAAGRRRLAAGAVRQRAASGAGRLRIVTKGSDMASCGTLRPPIEPGEQEWVPFDFTADLAGASIASVTGVACAVRAGTDAAPTSRLIGSPVRGAVTTLPDGSQMFAAGTGNAVAQLFGTALDGVDYLLSATIATSDGRVLILTVVFPCRAST